MPAEAQTLKHQHLTYAEQNENYDEVEHGQGGVLVTNQS